MTVSTSDPVLQRSERGARMLQERALVILAKLSWAHALIALLATAIVFVQLDLVGDFRVDDAYISLAFAKNLARGMGPVFGHGMRVEGYSNFLWVAICALLKLLFPNALYSAARVVALATFAGTLVFAFRTARTQASTFWAGLVVLLLVCATDFTRAAQSALETVPYVAVLTFTCWAYLVEPRDRRRLSGYGILVLCLLRIDGFVHAIFFIGFEVAHAWIGRRLRLRSLLGWLLVPLTLYAAYFAWRYSYYGLPLPTTYYAKAELGIAEKYRGLAYAWSSALDLGIPILIAGAIFACARRFDASRLFLAALVCTQLSYAISVGGDWMPFNRFALPILPALTILFVWGLSDIWHLARSTSPRAAILAAPVLVVCCASVAVLQDAHSINTPAESDKLGNAAHVKQHTQGLVEARTLYSWVLRRPGEKLVTDYGGVFAYFTEATVIEMWGLCNVDIALRGNTDGVASIYGKTCIPCYKEFQPDYFHANVPLARPADDIRNIDGVIAQIFQGEALDRVLDFRRNYVAGRVRDTRTNLAFYFLERRRANHALETRTPAAHIRVEYLL